MLNKRKRSPYILLLLLLTPKEEEEEYQWISESEVERRAACLTDSILIPSLDLFIFRFLIVSFALLDDNLPCRLNLAAAALFDFRAKRVPPSLI